MSLIWKEYLKYCPNSTIKPGELSNAQLRVIIERQKANKEYSDKNKVPPLPKEVIERYKEWKSKRKKYSFYDFSEEEQKEIKKAIGIFEEKFGVATSYYVSGSYANGSWVDLNTPQEERDIREPKKKCKAISDIDVVPNPCIGTLFVGRVDISCAPHGERFLIKDHEGYH